jgi:hypothetical protein
MQSIPTARARQALSVPVPQGSFPLQQLGRCQVTGRASLSVNVPFIGVRQLGSMAFMVISFHPHRSSRRAVAEIVESRDAIRFRSQTDRDAARDVAVLLFDIRLAVKRNSGRVPAK